MRCPRPSCTGTIRDGYCDVCGMPYSGPSALPTPPVSPPPTGTSTPAVPTGTSPTAGPTVAALLGYADNTPHLPVGHGVAGAPPSLTNSGPCHVPGCPGHIIDGYCDRCGSPADLPPAADAAPSARTAPVTSTLTSVALGSARLTTPTTSVRRSARARASGHIGAGLTVVPPEPVADPESFVLTDPVVPENRRFCPHCGEPVGRSTDEGPGRLEGYCPQCRQPYSFTPKLVRGDVVADQYEVRGPLAHGGMGWLYLAQDRNVSLRWVVLKGLLNVGDDQATSAALAEQRFLAQITHPLIVEIYNFVEYEAGTYIVMEFVGGRSLKQILKDRTLANGGVYSPLPVDEAIAFMLEILPAFSYLHDHGLLYCDFKPDNLMHVEDSVKLIDMGGVRHIDDDGSPIFGTVGFQAPEVATQGCSIPSDIYTIGRTLLLSCAEFRGYQTTYETSLPPLAELPTLVEHESLYRLIVKCCAQNPADRFQSADELRVQMLGVLREVVGAKRQGPAVTSALSEFFQPPLIASDRFTWQELPALRPSPSDPAASWLVNVESLPTSADRLAALRRPPTPSLDVKLALARAAIEVRDTALTKQTVESILAEDPWEWRAAWMEGLGCLNESDWTAAQASFNAVVGQVPGEVAPKFALAVACEMSGQFDVAETLYLACASTDAAYVTGAAFGLARTRTKRVDRIPGGKPDLEPILTALSMVPSTSGGWTESRRDMATLLVRHSRGLPDLQRAYAISHGAGLEPGVQASLDVAIYEKALATAPPGASPSLPLIGATPASQPALRKTLEKLLRGQAAVEADDARKIDLVERANRTRRWTLL